MEVAPWPPILNRAYIQATEVADVADSNHIRPTSSRPTVSKFGVSFWVLLVISWTPHNLLSPFRSSLSAEPEKQKSDFFVRSFGPLSKEVEVSSKEAVECDAEDFMGVVEVYVHQARDIHSISIYHKQDVHAKLCLNIEGLEVKTQDGEWINFTPSPDSFVVMIGDSLLAWTNGRLHSPLHRVMMTGNKASSIAFYYTEAGQKAESALRTYCGV
ncbi:putative 2-oxoglutarate-dependent dioxygenase AOP1 [Morella rubra]|uniref:Putative 2-oxoglutarate-dependent dioxygenase AOP1 n=1 Tax=Morella rubra TaxID=262757 RepID=A0A6A1W0A3_9ROSI|nr:putative 2-oxoglutarate-dependent dioxygenase AOP1 [Morella rubra]